MNIRESMKLVGALAETPKSNTLWVAVDASGKRVVGYNKGMLTHLARKAGMFDYTITQEPIPAKEHEVPASTGSWILSCVKTGKWWRADSKEAAMNLARKKGLLDYDV